MFFRIAHENFWQKTLRFLETDDILEVGDFIRIEEKDSLFYGDFLIVEVGPPEANWATQRYPRLVLVPLSVQGEDLKVYCLIAKAKAK